MAKAVQRLRPEGIEVTLTVRTGAAAEVLLDVSQESDLLVVGSRGLGRAREAILGSTSHLCAHQSHVPVAIIPLHRDSSCTE